MPDLIIGYNNQSLAGTQVVNGREVTYSTRDRFSYLSAGIGIPLFFGAQSARAAAAKLSWQKSIRQEELAKQTAGVERSNALRELYKYSQSLEYYENQALPNATRIAQAAGRQFENGEIDYLQWVMLINQTIMLRNEHITALSNYNQAYIQVLKTYNL